MIKLEVTCKIKCWCQWLKAHAVMSCCQALKLCYCLQSQRIKTLSTLVVSCLEVVLFKLIGGGRDCCCCYCCGRIALSTVDGSSGARGHCFEIINELILVLQPSSFLLIFLGLYLFTTILGRIKDKPLGGNIKLREEEVS